MSPLSILLLIAAYFGVLFIISYFTGKEDSNAAFFKAEKKAPWFLVAFGMVGASLSGVTFISVPGWVEESQFSYMQVVLGYILGYAVVAFVLLPIYYRLNVTSIYQYLDYRFGNTSYKTGAIFFLISRLIGSAFRLFIVAKVLQHFVFDAWNIPFVVTVILSVLLIWLYTARGGIKTIVWTDTFQTLFMLCSVVIALVMVSRNLGWGMTDLLSAPELKEYTKVFSTENILDKNYFWKAFIGGVFIVICMTGLDQDAMQKNLSIRTLRDAQKNMLSYSLVFVPVNIIFLLLGALLYVYAAAAGIEIPAEPDLLFPEIALNGGLSPVLAIVFILGLIAAAYSSADSGLTALTTSFCVDFLAIEKKPKEKQKGIRKKTHIGISLLLVVTIVLFNYVLKGSVVDQLFFAASYTYGPLLGLFAFGIFTRYQVYDKWVLPIALSAAGLTFLIGQLPSEKLGGYEFNYEIMVLNGIFTFIGLILIRRK